MCLPSRHAVLQDGPSSLQLHIKPCLQGMVRSSGSLSMGLPGEGVMGVQVLPGSVKAVNMVSCMKTVSGCVRSACA